MIDRGNLISLIGTYGKLCADIQGTTPEARVAAMKAVEDFCDAAILAEREACALMAAHAGHVELFTKISARPAP